MPSRLSKEWFSIISTTTCSICSRPGVGWPAGRCGNGSEPGVRRALAVRAKLRAHAGRLAYAAVAAAPATPAPAPASSRRRLIVAGSLIGTVRG